MSSSLTVSSGAPPAPSTSQTTSPEPRPSVFSPQSKTTSCREVRVVADRSLDITGSFLRVTVGKEGHRESFFLHEKLFTSHSAYLQRAAKEQWLDQNGVILLPDDDPITFQLYAVLTYTGLLTTKSLPFEWKTLVDVYVLAEKLQDTWAKNHVIDAMHSFVAERLPRSSANISRSTQFGDCISAASLAALFAGTTNGSQARKLVVELFADNGSGSWLASAADSLPQEFLIGIAIRLLQNRPYVVFGNVLDRPASDYHEKDGGKERPVREYLEKVAPLTEVAPSAPTVKPSDTDDKTCSTHAAPLELQNTSAPMKIAAPSAPA